MKKITIIYIFVFYVLTTNINTLPFLQVGPKSTELITNLQEQLSTMSNTKIKKLIKKASQKKGQSNGKKKDFSSLPKQMSLFDLIKESIEKEKEEREEDKECQNSEEFQLKKLISEKWAEADQLSDSDEKDSHEKMKKNLK